MAFQKKHEDLSYDARSNFGVKGWWVIIFSALNWAFYGSIVNSSMNVVVPQLAGRLQVEPGTLLSLSTPAGIIALFFCLLVGKVVEKIGAKLVNGILLILGAIAVFFWASSGSVVAYTISLICVVCLMNGVQLVAGNTFITNWFPRKKGIAIGWATMGLNISSAFFVTILVRLTALLGDIKYALWVVAGCLIVLAIINFTAYKDYPEQWKAYPDNDPNSPVRSTEKPVTGWTTLKVLKQKETWLMGLGNGFYGMVTIGFVSTLIPSMMMKGYTQPQALLMMTVTSLFGLVGSYLCGFLDQKFGAQKSSVIYGIWVVIGICFYFVPGDIGTWVYLIMIGLSIGGSNNYPPSMTAQIFGRAGSVVAFPVIFFIKGLLCGSPYLVLGLSQNITGDYRAAWIIFAVLAAVAAVMFFFTDMNPKKDPIEEAHAAE
ncbi:MAG: MFS transporter [Lachnospiraceae bacterium]|jgi:OFA family oxalate/formate antiporter-like MFS transporter